MPAYREDPDIFSEALESVLNQSFKDFEIILIFDDPSNRGLIELAGQYAQNDTRVKIVVNFKNIGLAKSLNKAISLSRGRVFCRMDSDDVSYRKRFESQLEELSIKKLDLVGSKVDVIDEKGKYMYTSSPIPLTSKAIAKSLRWNNCVAHPSWMGKREVFASGYRSIGLCEDYDFLLRATLSGFKIGNCNESLLAYRMTEQSISRSNLYEQFLCQKYLSKCYAKKLIAQEKCLKDWVKANYSSEKNEAYSRANMLFNKALNGLARGRFIDITAIFKIPFVSFQYCDKVRRLVVAGLIGRFFG